MSGPRLRSAMLLCALLTAILSIQVTAQAVSTVGGLAGAPFRLGSGARGMAMGNAMAAVIDGPIVGSDNPALVPFQSDLHASAAYSLLSLDRRLNLLSFGQALHPNAGISIQVMNAGVGNIDLRTTDGLPNGTASTSENAFLLSFGLQPRPQIGVGVSAKILYYSLYTDVKSTTVGFDLGFLYRITDELTFGAALLDVGSDYHWETSKIYAEQGQSTVDRFPRRTELSLSETPAGWHVTAAAQVEWIGRTAFWKAGTEVRLVEGVWIRGGVDQVSFSGATNARPAGGLAVQQTLGRWFLSVEYTYVLEPFSPAGIHVIGASVSFP